MRSQCLLEYDGISILAPLGTGRLHSIAGIYWAAKRGVRPNPLEPPMCTGLTSSMQRNACAIASYCELTFSLVHVLYVGGSELHKLNEGVVRPFSLDNKSNLEREVTV